MFCRIGWPPKDSTEKWVIKVRVYKIERDSLAPEHTCWRVHMCVHVCFICKKPSHCGRPAKTWVKNLPCPESSGLWQDGVWNTCPGESICCPRSHGCSLVMVSSSRPDLHFLLLKSHDHPASSHTMLGLTSFMHKCSETKTWLRETLDLSQCTNYFMFFCVS